MVSSIFLSLRLKGNDDDEAGLMQFLQPFGKSNLTLFPGQPYGFIEFENIESAEQLVNKTKKSAEDVVANSCEIEFGQKIRNVFFFYTKLKFEELHKENENITPNASRNIDIPGLTVYPEFITQEQEKSFLSGVEKQKWSFEDEHKFQSYGIEYNFQTSSIHKDRPARSLEDLNSTELYSKVIEIAKNYNLDHFDQITIEEFYAGQGVSPRLESHNSFESVIAILCLSSGVVFTWKNDKGFQKHHYIPPRTLLIIADEARYAWTYYVTARKIDKVEGQTVHRKKRIAITFRKLRKDNLCKCVWPHLCDSQYQKPLPAFENVKLEQDSNLSNTHQEENKGEAKLTDWEKKYVYNTYEKIAPHFSTTRYRPWPKVESFLNSLPVGTLVGDIGCGNGRYLGVNSDNIMMIGTDRSENFMKICKEKSFEVFSADSLRLPLRDEAFDCTISIAVIHHFSTRQLRLQAIKEITRVTKKGGLILIYVWAMEQENLKVTQQDVLVPWNLQVKYETEKKLTNLLEDANTPENIVSDPTENISDQQKNDIVINEGKKTLVYKRYYHMFKKGELEELVQEAGGVEIRESFYDNDNWCVILKKKL